MWTKNFQMFKVDLEKAEEPEIKVSTSVGYWKSKRIPEKNICFIDCTKAFHYGKLLKRQEHQSTLPASWETCMQVKRQQLELDMEQQTVSKLGKEYINSVYCLLI